MKPNQEYKCTVIFRNNHTGETGQHIYFIESLDDRNAKLEARSRFMADFEPELSGSAIVYLSLKAEVEPVSQLELF